MPPETAPSTAPAGPVIVQSPRSAAAEAYRALRTNLRFASLDHELKTILLTSAGPGEGTTTTVANLGVSLAESGQRILLLDCNLRQPGLHLLFGLPRSPGLTDFLMATESEPIIAATAVEGLSLLSAGDEIPNPAEFVASVRLTRLLEGLVGRFDRILIDSPPVGVVMDAATLAPRVDGVVLIVSAGRTRRDIARRARERLAAAGARILGAVLNRAKLERVVAEYHHSASKN